MRAGHSAFLISTRNSAAAVAHLLPRVGIKHLLVSKDQAMQLLASTACEQVSSDGGPIVNIHSIPLFESLYGHLSAPFEPLPPMKKPGLDSPALIVHSSGLRFYLA